MIPWHRLIATAGLVTFAACILAPTGADDRPPPAKVAVPPQVSPEKKPFEYPPNATDAEKQEIDLRRVRDWETDPALRKKLLVAYSFESLEDRLKFDVPARKRLTKSFSTPDLDLAKWKPHLYTEQRSKIPPATLATLMMEEKVTHEVQFERIQALASLHQVEVQKFVTNPGFGHMRVISLRFQKTVEVPPKDWSEGDRGEPVSLPKWGTFFTPSQDKKGPTLPSMFALASFHTSTANEFARPDSWGLVKDKTQVAGFRSHTLGYIPDEWSRRRHDQENPVKDKSGKITEYPLIEKWAVRKVELIGLLMHDSPVAYVNPDNKLPTMAAVKEAKTREVTAFESSGLKDLAAGKEVVVVEATTNQVRMVGAIRMAGACVKCHEGSRGDLLGAFSYDLVRDPAFVAPQK